MMLRARTVSNNVSELVVLVACEGPQRNEEGEELNESFLRTDGQTRQVYHGIVRNEGEEAELATKSKGTSVAEYK